MGGSSIPGENQIIYFPRSPNPQQAAALIPVYEISLLQTMVKKIARDDNVFGAIGYEIFPLALAEPPDGLEAVPSFRATESSFCEVSQAQAKTQSFVNLTQDVKRGKPLQVEGRVGAQDTVIETGDVESDNEVEPFEVFDESLDFMLTVYLEYIGRDLIENGDRYTHQVCILPSAYLFRQLLGFEVEETYPEVPARSLFGGSTVDPGGRRFTFDAVVPQVLFSGKISQKLERGRFIQRFVSGAALGRVDARRASV